MTKFLAFVTFLSVCALVAAYTDMDDSVNPEEVVKDDTKIKQYMDCFLGRQMKNNCTPQILGYKSHLLEAISDGCKECNDVERHMLKVFIATLKRAVSKPDFDEFEAKFDPNNHLETTFADIANF